MATKSINQVVRIAVQESIKKGKDNQVADALSRRPDMEQDSEESKLNLCAISVVKPVWLEEVIQGYNLDEQAKGLLA